MVIEEKGSGVNLYTVLRTRKLSRINDKNTVGMFRGLSGYCGLIQANIPSNNNCNNPSLQDGGSIGRMLLVFFSPTSERARGIRIIGTSTTIHTLPYYLHPPNDLRVGWKNPTPPVPFPSAKGSPGRVGNPNSNTR